MQTFNNDLPNLNLTRRSFLLNSSNVLAFLTIPFDQLNLWPTVLRDYGFVGLELQPAESNEPDHFIEGGKRLTNENGILGPEAPIFIPLSIDVFSLRDFVDLLGSVQTPIGNIVLVTHASSIGNIKMRLYSDQQSPRTYLEDLRQTLTDPSKSIAIPDFLIAGNNTTTVHIKGCNIGKAKRFVEEFRLALGDKVIVTAPLHAHWISYLPGEYVIEYMGYEFSARSKSKITRGQMLELLRKGDCSGKKFTYYDGKDIESTAWDNWIPLQAKVNKSWKSEKRLEINVNGKTTDVPSCLHGKRAEAKFAFNLDLNIPIDNRDGKYQLTDAEKLKALDGKKGPDTNMSVYDPNYPDPAKPFPVYERLGFCNREDFIANVNWLIPHKRFELTLPITVTYYDYRLVVPILYRDGPLKDTLIFNFHAEQGSSYSEPLPALVESDPRFFIEIKN